MSGRSTIHDRRPRGRMRRVLLAGMCLLGLGSARAETVTDVAGRQVVLPAEVHRIVLGEGRLIYALEPLEGAQLFDRVVGWQGELIGADKQIVGQLRKRFPQIDKIPLIGKDTPDSVSPERVLDLHPDLAILSVSGHGPGSDSALVGQLESAHIPILFVDFRTHPLEDTARSMTLIGQAIGRQAQARAFVDFYNDHLNAVRARVASVPQAQRPRVFIDMLAGTRECCHTAGRGNMGAFIEAAGGRNIAASMLPGALGEISAEGLISADPDVLILDGTRGPDATGPGLRMGAEVTPQMAQESLTKLLSLPELASLRAVRDGRAYGLWHSFYDSPFNILAVEAMAKWFYPDRFRDLDPDATRRELDARFTQLPMTGTYWTQEHTDAPAVGH